ncbi:hypothetical protein [Photobacterium kishitanii]|uniref:hypothetical protein n=1 Tax=Photobacterium kishitanii TaxID=318456 RepID=UPI000436B140|nr:hypothetical protein [Photobacterium kishitanii]CEO40542.1 hypothetical protein PPBDW_I50048 [Photobacterium kishitanii]
MDQCSNCQSYDMERVHRKFYQRLWVRRISVCRQCGNIQKTFKYAFLGKTNSTENL